MGGSTKQANFLLPEDLLDELKMTVSKRQQSKVVADALRKELKRLKMARILGLNRPFEGKNVGLGS